MSHTLSILLLHGDAEARLLAGADDLLRGCLPHCDLSWRAAWMPRPDELAPGAPAHEELRRCGLLPEPDGRALLEQRHDLVLLTLFPAVAQPFLRHRAGGGGVLVHRGMRADWSESQVALAAECIEEPALSPPEAATALEPVVEDLQRRGAVVALCTTFRHVPAPLEHRGAGATASLRDLVRGANLEVARLSQRTGCFVLDLDRPLAQEGGEALGADCFGGGDRAAELAIEELVGLVFDALPEAAFPSEVA